MIGDESYPLPRRDRLKQLRAFCYAARFRSISRAAERVYLSQPAVSQQVRTLEDELAVTLFDRHGSRIALTPAGERLYHVAKPLVEQLDRLPDTFTERFRGVASAGLNVAAGQTTAVSVLPALLKRFKEQYPGVRLNVKVTDGRRRLQWLVAYEVDVAVAAVDVPPPGVEFHPLLTSEMMFITAEDHPLAGHTSMDLADVTAYPIVTHTASHYVSRVTDGILRQHGHVADPVLEVDGWHVIKQYVEAGVGVAIVPDICLADQDRLWSSSASRYFPRRVYGVLTRRDEIQSLAAEWFVRTVGEMRSADDGG